MTFAVSTRLDYILPDWKAALMIETLDSQPEIWTNVQ